VANPVPVPLQSGEAPSLRQPTRNSLASSIASAVAEAIASGHLKPGERVVELALAEQMEVSRVPVREALKVLHAQGILSGGSHRGYRIATFDDTTVQQVIEVRLMLETILLRDAIAGWRTRGPDLSGLDEAIGGMKIAAKIENRLASLSADLEFHRAIARAADNDIAATLWEAIARHVMIIFARKEYRDDDLNAIVAQHQSFRDYIERAIAEDHGADEISAALKDHLLQVSRARRMPAGAPAGPAPGEG
jgi:DNA-binding GntR family transcriptional regulator